MKLSIALLALFAVAAAVHPFACTYTDQMGRQYDLSPLRLDDGAVYTYHLNGAIYEFNVCGDVDGLDFVGRFAPNAANISKAVVIKTVDRVSENAGSRPEWSDLSSKEAGVELVLGEGSVCGSSQRKTSFEFLCSKASMGMMLRVTEVQPVDACYEIITISTSYACPLDSEAEGEVTEVIAFPLIPFIVSGCIFFCALVYVIRRRRNHQALIRRNKEKQMVQFSNVAFQQIPMEDFTRQQQQQIASPFLQAPQYFVYPSVQAPVQQQASLVSDEDLARKLQADFDRGL